ncbi:FHA domain-containing protein [Lacisediminihabitans sp.]|uniref:FHA domain-containing protein n=1 Tax=Lacisediminihabitans sp. TaxID=2787631 RepID=UPI00374DAF41
MASPARLDIDLTFSLVEPGTPDSTSDSLEGTVTASGTHVEVYASKPELFVQRRAVKLSDLRAIAAEVAALGLTVSFSGPHGLIGRIGAVNAPLNQRLVTRSPHIVLGSTKALAPLLRRPDPSAAQSILLPPPTLFPLVPTVSRRVRRRVTTTHYTPGSGRPRLIFVVGSENWDGRPPREFDLLPTVTRIGSSEQAHLRLEGLDPVHAEIRHDENDEYVFYPRGEVAGGVEREKGVGQILRTGARIEMGQWPWLSSARSMRTTGARSAAVWAESSPCRSHNPAAPSGGRTESPGQTRVSRATRRLPQPRAAW